MKRVLVQREDFDPASELERLEGEGVGAVTSFVGIVRPDGSDMVALELETWLAVALPSLARIADDAMARWPLKAVTLIHRYGRLPVGSRIVFVAAAASHRKATIDATHFLIDWAKTRAPFWKREWLADGQSRWVVAKPEDDNAAGKWGPPPPG